MISSKSLIFVAISIFVHLAFGRGYNGLNAIQIEDLFDGELEDTDSKETVDAVMQLSKEVSHDFTSTIRDEMIYSLGRRTRGDRLVAKASKNQVWVSPKNVSMQLTYPSQGVGAMITYLNIVVYQSSNMGRPYLVRGGLHQRFITVIVEAYNTTYANYIAEIYGI